MSITDDFSLLPLALSAYCDEEQLHVELADARRISVPLGWFPRLLNAMPEQRAKWEVIGRGEGLHWEEIDEDISIASLLGLPSD